MNNGPVVRQGGTGRVVTVRDLSPDQKEVYDSALAWARSSENRPILTIGGFAGTGKSTLTGLIGSLGELQPIAFCAFTGKASSVLRSKLAHLKPRSKPYTEETRPYRDNDCTSFCGTIHSLIYVPVVEKGVIVGWERRDELDAPYKLIIVDEASMVSDDILLDLRSYGIPILAVGDHGQLPPVQGDGSMMQHPDLRLEKIHRQAEGNPIIALSKSIRETGRLNRQLQGEHVRFYRPAQLDALLQSRYEIPTRVVQSVTIVYTNRRRVVTNLKVRSILKQAGPPQRGEQVVCLRNVKGLPVYNGMRGIIQDLHGRDRKFPWQLVAGIWFEGNVDFRASMCSVQFNRDKTFSALPDVEAALLEASKKTFRIFSWEQVGHLFDFGYAMTAWKCQGSQFEDVLAILERMPGTTEDDWRRYCYTVVTRASERLSIVSES